MMTMMYGSEKMMAGKPPLPITATGPCFPGRYSPTYRNSTDPMRRCMTNPSGDIFGGLNDGLLSRAEVLAAVDMGKHHHHHNHQSPGPGNGNGGGQGNGSLGPGSTGSPGPLTQLKHDVMSPYHHHHGMGGHSGGQANHRGHQMHPGMDGLDLLEPISSSTMTTLTPMSDGSGHGPLHPSVYGAGMMTGHHHHHPHSGTGPNGHPHHHHHHHHHHAAAAAAAAAAVGMIGASGGAGLQHPDTDTDPRELEAFAERFKQRRIKLGVTQADVGKALANLKLPGVGALSQSTICRFESLTLSHNNMIALKPILQAWLEEAEAQAKNKRRDPDAPSVLPAGEKKRKRTSIAAPEKRSLEAYFAVQPRPSGEKIAAIAEKLDLKKNVVRVWFCNQRQKQKRMKFAAQH
ncbi:inhibitory POU protein isoform X2 [Adelges cooleyi]|uniref:inhibitory POU protein isoform X2 n=1 Tax=Adelges cooleyi TaxID=133065 RepID=UPI0021803036|nr:inhibitory POU protein isoform X2 [Adelges cooleyi]